MYTPHCGIELLIVIIFTHVLSTNTEEGRTRGNYIQKGDW